MPKFSLLIACVKDLIRGLRNDDPLCSVRRQLGSAKTLSMVLSDLDWYRLHTIHMHADILTQPTCLGDTCGTHIHTFGAFPPFQDLLPLLEQCGEDDDVLQNDLIR